MSKNELTFKRKEKKYLILEHSFDEIKDELVNHIPVYIFKGDKAASGIETTYLDTKDFLLFSEYLNQRKFRYKIRLRRYINENQIEEVFLVELKVKANSISLKRRFVLPADLLKRFLEGADIKAEIKEANQGLAGALKTYKLISRLIKLNGFVPVLRSSYERMAFQKKTRKVRITVDHNIRHEKLLGTAKTATLDAVILESKISGKSPKWYKKMVNQLSLLKQTRFSKFATGLNSLYFPDRGKYNFDCSKEEERETPDLVRASYELIKKAFKLEECDF
ncbi:MAG: polyphosphate polymerase domain-containing protein [Candidatus Cloacimonetes bacterium]|nr:polyphosphate polymerase domain-containing protein [Candidatus Cloacimonadota bacterium]